MKAVYRWVFILGVASACVCMPVSLNAEASESAFASEEETSESELSTEDETETGTETEPDTELEHETKTEPDTELETESETESDTELEPETKTEPETELEAGTESEITQESESISTEVFCLDTPVLDMAYAKASGTRISWSAVDGADGYAVLRKAEDGDWELLATTMSLNYTDKSELQDGATWYYTVRAWLGDEESALANQWDPSFWSDCDQEGVYSIGLAAPELIGATALADGTEVEWKAAEGASAYAVYRKVTGGSWKMIAVTDELCYVDRSELTSGKTYSYMVRACTGSIFEACANQYDAAYWSGYDSEGIQTVYLSSPELDMAYAAANGTRISWETVQGADGYAIFRKAEDEDWKLLTMTTDLSYTDASSRVSGTVYYYTVRAYVTNASRARANRYDAAYWSGCDSNGVKAVCLEAPVLTGISQSTGTVLVSWESVEYADGYAVYRRESGEGWMLLGTTTDTAYADISSESNGSTYYYTVRAYAGAAATTERYSAAYWSGFDPVGLAIETETSYTTRALILAADFIEANTTSEMTQRQKLDACFNAILRLSYTRTYDTADASNLSSFAEQLFANRTGNCYRYAAGFACIAAELGYDVRVVVGQITARAGGLTPHGWTEVCVDGVWYLCDPDMQAFNSNYSGQYYMTSASAIGLTYAVSVKYTLRIEKGTAVWYS